MQKKYLIYHHSRIEYQIFGEGDDMIVAFHGYGESAESFAVLDDFIRKKCTIIAINLPFHGNTHWEEHEPFLPETVFEIIQQINVKTEQPFTLLGYSMGGRIALKLYEQYPLRIKKMILIAPDGFHKNIWHWLSTQTIIGNELFKFCMHYPRPMFFLMELSFKLGIFNKSVYTFVKYYLNEKTSRLILYKRWTTLRKFYPSLTAIQKSIVKYKTNMYLLFGKYDKIIVTKRGLQFQGNVKDFVSIIEIEAGHQLLKEKYAEQIASFL